MYAEHRPTGQAMPLPAVPAKSFARRPRRLHTLVLAGVCFLITMSLSLSFLAESGHLALAVSPASLVLFVVLMALCIVAIYSDREASRQPFHAFSIACLSWLLGLGYRGASLVISQSSPILERVWGSPYDHMTRAAVMSIIGFLLFWLGYRSPIGPRLSRIVPFVSFEHQRLGPQTMVRLYVAYAIGWAGRCMVWYGGMYHHSTALTVDIASVSWLRMIAGFADMSLWIIFATKNARRDNFLSFLPWIVLEFANGLVDGGRTKMVWGLIIFFVTRSLYGRKSISWKAVGLTLAVALFVILPATTLFRTAYYSVIREHGEAGPQAAVVALGRWEEAYRTTGINPEGIVNRFGYLDPFLIVLDRVPDVYPFEHGNTFLLQSVTAPIPRFLWSGKPGFSPSQRFATLFFDVSETGLSVSIGLIAEGFFNFGVWGLALLFAVGVWLRLHWERFRIYRRLEIASAARFMYIWMLASPVVSLATVFGSIWRAQLDLYIFYLLALGLPTIVRYRSLTRAAGDTEQER